MSLRRTFIASAAATLLAAALPAAAIDWPTKPVKIVVPFAPGGGSDFIARYIARRLADELKQPFIVDNKPGAGGNIGAEQGIKSAPDGYTLTLIASSYTVNPSVYKLNFDPINDITPIIQLSQGPLIIVTNSSVPAKDLKEFVALARAKPGDINFASSGQGSIIHAASELFNQRAGTRMVHVPYKGSGPALTDTISGVTQVFFSSATTAVPHIQGGRLKALAVTTSKRIPALPNVPTVGESGIPNYEVTLWHGLIGPKGMPPEIVSKINAAVSKSLQLKETAEQLQNDGVAPAGGTPEQFAKTIRIETEMWRKVVQEAHIRAE
ncbi:MAG TPA: tripartite tricarboxylate transporter substrate binding protein [Usitatibacter sp.]|nr:tripartite tricarboxylate transporter substrate binding protein [Usitatibacter sp.]